MLTAAGTACDVFVRRIGQLFQIPVVSVSVVGDESKVPAVAEGESNEIVAVAAAGLKADDVLADMANQMLVLSIRRNGNLHRAVESRLSRGKATRLIVSSALTKKKLSNELLDQGATGWYLFDAAAQQNQNDLPMPMVLSADEVDGGEFLLHWTRRRVGPWPDHCLLYTSPSPRDQRGSRMPSSA